MYKIKRSKFFNLYYAYVFQYQSWFKMHISDLVFSKLTIVPREVELIETQLDHLFNELHNTELTEISTEFLPLLKAIVIHERRTIAFDIEMRSSFTFNHELRITLDKELEDINDIMNDGWFEKTEMQILPKVTDFLSVQHAEKLLFENSLFHFKERIFDEKFHILTAPALFIPDLDYYRLTCSLRNNPINVAYLDIDDFKQFNTKYGEPRIDRDVLPKFMSALESHVYSHGHAYRFGGDEYVVLLPNMKNSTAITFMNDFQSKLLNLSFFEIPDKLTVSIGLFEVVENSIQTDMEVVERAAYAKKIAKEKGKNRIASYSKHGYKDEDVSIASDKVLYQYDT
jgi:diguanylate cyclase (GGDEF)-like protein